MPANRIAGMLAMGIAVEAADIQQKPTPEIKFVYKRCIVMLDNQM